MARQRRYIAEYRRERGYWVVEMREPGEAHARGRTLRDARQKIRQALSRWLGDAAFSVPIEENVALPSPARRELQRQRLARRRAEQQALEAVTATMSAARALTRAGLSVRDAGELLGLSGARVSQILRQRRDVDS